MTSLEQLIEPIRHSHHMPEVVARLNSEMEAERARRQKIYEEMTSEQKIEFIDGAVILHSPARNEHLGATFLISRLVSTFVDLNKLGTVKVGKCLCVFPRNDYEPDVVFFGEKKANSLEPGAMQFPVPEFVVEVLSESAETRDRGVKFEDFAANGVGEYWIVDAKVQVVERYLLEDGNYKLRLKSGTGIIKSPVISGFETDIEALFDEDRNLEALRNWMN